MEKIKEYRMPYQLAYFDCDYTGHLSIEMMLMLMILASEKQNESLGFGLDETQKLGGGWVILDYEGHLNGELPKDREQITVGTRIKAYNRFFVVREFWLDNAAGKRVAEVSGLFTFMDLQKRKMAPIPAEIMAPYQQAATIRLPRPQSPDKVTPDEKWSSKQYRARYADIDSNGHVNNARYVEWLLDTLPAGFLKDHCLTAFRLNYRREVRPRSLVTSLLGPLMSNGDQLTSQHVIQIDGKTHACASFEWQKIQ